ncbi:MAG TPA: protein kinase [Solirubrobacteraceae bacterium]|nr:protein kinase [Solirubrobacteraceae bacterium]
MASPVKVASVPVSIVIADDHAMVRSGLRVLLDSEPDLNVVAEAGDVSTALECARTHRPAVIVLDLNMPGEPSLPAIPRFLEAAPGTAVVMLTMQSEPAYAREALSAGASGYVVKTSAEADLVEAVRAAAAGGTYLTPALGASLARTMWHQPPPVPAQPPAGDPEPEPGDVFAGHRVDGVAGRGAMGVVLRATDLVLDRAVALKLIAPMYARDPVFRARFERECRLAAGIDHPNVVEIFRAGDEGGRLYVTMRYIDGTDLKSLIARERRLEPERAVALVAQVAGALDAAHRRGLVHRDVKPANILVASREGVERAFLTDFGISKQRTETPDTALTGAGMALGSVDYMAPEQAQVRDLDARTDVYALGCVLFHALTGSVPFIRGNDFERMWAHVHEPAPAVSSIEPRLPEALDPVLARALEKAPGDRQQSAGGFAREARAAVAG